MKRFFTLLIIFILVFPVAFAEVSDISSLSEDELFVIWRDSARQLRTTGAYPFLSLKKGPSGEEVSALQTRLSELIFYTPITSKYDKSKRNPHPLDS